MNHHKIISNAVKNSAVVLLLHVLNQAIPFLLLPYLTHQLGLQAYAVTAFFMGLITLAGVVTDYGFNLSITAKIAQANRHRAYLNLLIGAVMAAKVILFLLLTIVLLPYIALNNTYHAYQLAFYWVLFPILGQALQPLCFFLGLEKMQVFLLLTLLTRLLYAALIVCWVHDSSDVVWVIFAQGMMHISAAILAIALMWRWGYIPRWPSKKNILNVWSQSSPFFWSRAASSTYTAGGAVFLGLVGNLQQLAYFSIAEQLYKAGQSLLTPITQVLYPMMVRTKQFSVLMHFIQYASLFYFVILIVFSLFGAPIVVLLFGQDYGQALPTLSIFTMILVFYAPSVLMGYPFLGAIGKAEFANRSVLIAGALQLIALLILLLSAKTLAIHVAGSIFLVELTVLLLRVYWLRRFYFAQSSVLRAH